MNATKKLDKKLLEIFSHFNLEAPELVTFLTLEQLGTTNVKTLLKKLDYPRTTVYEYLKRLESAGIVEVDKKSSPTLYTARSVSAIKNILEQNLVELNSQIKLLEVIEKSQKSADSSQSPIPAPIINKKEVLELVKKEKFNEMLMINLSGNPGNKTSILELILSALKPKNTKIKELVAGSITMKDFKTHYSNPHLSFQVTKSNQTSKTIKFLFSTCIIWGDIDAESFYITNNPELYQKEKEIFDLLWKSTYLQ